MYVDMFLTEPGLFRIVTTQFLPFVELYVRYTVPSDPTGTELTVL